MSLRKIAVASLLLLTMWIGVVSAQDDSTLASGVGDNRNQARELSPMVERPRYSVFWYLADTFTSSSSDPVPSCGAVDHTVWATFVAPQTGKMFIGTDGTQYDTVLTIYKSTATTANEVGCNNDAGSGNKSVVFFNMQAGVRYYVLIGRLQSSAPIDSSNNEVTLSFSSNDEYTRPYVIPSSGSYNNVQEVIELASSDVITTCAYTNSHSHGVWYSFKPTTSRVYEFNTFGSSYDTLIAIYRASDYSPVLNGCNDDVNTVGDALRQSRIRPTLVANTRYIIFVAKYGVASPAENMTLNLTVRPR